MAEPSSLVWLYAIAGPCDEQRLGSHVGVAGAPLRVIGVRGLAAVASSVDSERFGADALRRNLEDLDWLASVARAHDAVVRALCEQDATIPLRLATIYASDEHVRKLLDERQVQLGTALGTVSGRTEWGVKAYASAGSARSDRELVRVQARTGRAYLDRRRSQLSARRVAERSAAAQALDAHAALTALAADSRTHPPRDRRVTGQRDHEVLNAAYLVDDSRTPVFHQAVTDQDDCHQSVRLILTGPWPPYSFTTLDEAPS